MDPNKTEQEQFIVWRQSMSPALSDKEVLQMMRTAKENLANFNMPKAKGRKLKEFIERIKPLLEHATPEQKVKIYQQLSEVKSKIVARTAKDLENPPKIMQHRAKRDQEREEQLKYRDIAKRDDDDFYPGDTESQQLMRYVKQHYPNATTKQQAFIKFAQRALMHSQEEDKKQDQEIEDLTKDVDQIKQKLTKLPVNESIDYLEEK